MVCRLGHFYLFGTALCEGDIKTTYDRQDAGQAAPRSLGHGCPLCGVSSFYIDEQ